jgi:two-component system sensor histidine kinase KdpD
VRGRYRILLGAAAGVGKTYRMLQEGRQAASEGIDVVIGYLEPHDRPETTALAEGLEAVSRRKAGHGSLELDEFDPDALIRRAPELALVDELAHTNAPGSKNAKRYEDIDEVLEAGIDVISTVNVQHLESLNDAVYEVILVDLSPDALQQRLRAGKVYPADRAEAALQNFFRADKLAALRELSLREVVEDAGARRSADVLDPLSRQAVGERILALVKPEPSAQRLLRRAWRSAQRLGADVDALWVRSPGKEPSEEQKVQLAALRRLAIILGAHFVEEEGDDLVDTVRRVVVDRGSTYVLLGTPDESRRREVTRGSLLSRMVRELPGVDIRVVAARSRRQELEA